MNNRKNKGKSSWGGLIAVVIILLVNMASSGADAEVFAILIVLAAIIAIVVAFTFIVKKALGAGKIDAAKITSYLNREEKGEERVFVRREPSTASYDEQAQEKNFIRDRERRLAQLDGFLKNGIIGKEEYNILKSRYLKEKI